MKFKICTAEDSDALVNIALRSYLDHYTYLWNDGGNAYIQANFNNDTMREELANSNSIFYLIYLEDTIVGYCKINIDKAIGHYSAEEALELERIYIIKEATGKGSRTRVIDFVMDLAREKLKTMVWLKAMDSSAAVAFYEKQEFIITDAYHLTFPTMKDECRKILVMCRVI